MTHEQYEEQKRRLAEQHRSLVEMVDSAYQSQLRALDMVWRMMSGEGPGNPLPVPASVAAPPQPAAPAPPARPRRQAGELDAEVLASLPELPEEFVFSDVCRLLGYTPDRSSLHRTLQALTGSGHIAVVSFGTGTLPTRYRKALAQEDDAGA